MKIDEHGAIRPLTEIVRTIGAGLAAVAVPAALVALAPPALAEPVPVLHFGFDAPAQSQPQCMTDAEFAMNSMGQRS